MTETNYTGKQRFSIEHTPTSGEVVVEIDFDHKFDKVDGMLDAIHEMVHFWTGAERNVDDFEGDEVKAFLKNVTCKALALQYEYNLNTQGVISFFRNEEGYFPLDGTSGITIIKVSEMEMDYYQDYNIKELEIA